MADVTETQVITPWDKLKKSVGGMLIGVILLPLSFVILSFSTCREKASEVLKGAFPVAEAQKAAAEKKAVYATGKIQADPIGDPEFIKPGPYLELERSGEIYAWVHKEETKEEKDGNTTKKTTRHYCQLEWTSKPDENVSSQKGCEGKYNKPRTIKDQSFSAQVFVAAGGSTYSVSDSVDYEGMPALKVSSANLINPNLPNKDGKFYPDGVCETMGCERISFSGTTYTPGADHTVVGGLTGTNFVEFSTGKEGLMAGKFLKLGPGDYKSVMKAVASSDSTATMIIFAISVAAFWAGLVLLSGPVIQIIEFIPFVGGLGSGLIKVVFGIFAFIIMGITFLLIKFWWVVLLVVVGGGFALYMMKRNKGQQTA